MMATEDSFSERWNSGQEIISLGVKGFELLEAVKSAELTPFDKKTGKRIVNSETLPLPYLKALLRTRGEDPTGLTEKEIKDLVKVEISEREVQDPLSPHFPWEDGILGFFSDSSIRRFIYKVEEFNAFQDKLKKSITRQKAMPLHSTKWISGEDLVARWEIVGYELFDFMKQGLQAYTSYGKRIVDSDPLERAPRYTFEQIVGNIRAKQQAGHVLGGPIRPPLSEGEISARAKSAFKSQTLEIVNLPKNCKLISFTIPDNEKKADEIISQAMAFLFKMEEVLSFEREHGIIPQVPPVLSTSPTLPPSPDDKDNIISTLKQSGTSDVALPERSWFTVVDLSRRWKIPEADVEHFIETGKLKAELRQGSMGDPPTESNRLREYVASRVRISVLPGVILLGGEYVVVVPAEVRRFETQYGLNVSADVSDPSKDPQKNPKRTALQSFIKKEGAWMITYEGREDIIGNLLGLQYIAYLLERPGESVSCIDLYHLCDAVNPSDGPTITKEQAAQEGLYFAARSKKIEAINTPQAKKELGKKYRQLQTDSEQAESDIEKNEIEKEMEAIMQALKKNRFPDPINSKAQANIKKGFNRAIKAIDQSEVKALAAYLKDNIKPDGKYGYIYTGAPWEIIL